MANNFHWCVHFFFFCYCCPLILSFFVFLFASVQFSVCLFGLVWYHCLQSLVSFYFDKKKRKQFVTFLFRLFRSFFYDYFLFVGDTLSVIINERLFSAFIGWIIQRLSAESEWSLVPVCIFSSCRFVCTWWTQKPSCTTN